MHRAAQRRKRKFHKTLCEQFFYSADSDHYIHNTRAVSITEGDDPYPHRRFVNRKGKFMELFGKVRQFRPTDPIFCKSGGINMSRTFAL